MPLDGPRKKPVQAAGPEGEEVRAASSRHLGSASPCSGEGLA